MSKRLTVMKAKHRSIRLQIMLDSAEVAALDDWRFNKRMSSRAAAVREIIRRGLAAEGLELAGQGRKSADFGIIEAPDED